MGFCKTEFFFDYLSFSSDYLASIKNYIAERDGLKPDEELSQKQIIEAEKMLKPYQHQWG